MATFEEKRAASASQARRVVDEVLGIARREHAVVAVMGGSKPLVTIKKQVPDYNDTYFRAMLSGIEYATHGHFDQGRESAGYTEWLLRAQLVDVTVQASKSAT
jgi:hypothetical protein